MRHDLGNNIFAILAERRSFVQFLLGMGHAGDHDGVFLTEMLDDVESPNLSTMIRRIRQPMTNEEYSHFVLMLLRAGTRQVPHFQIFATYGHLSTADFPPAKPEPVTPSEGAVSAEDEEKVLGTIPHTGLSLNPLLGIADQLLAPVSRAQAAAAPEAAWSTA